MKAVIFDLFGTLATSLDPENTLIKGLNLPFSYGYVEKFTCGRKFVDREHYISTLVKNFRLEDSESSRNKVDRLLNISAESVKIKNDAKEILALFRDKGYKIGLISNIATPDYDIIRRLNLQKYFDTIIYSYEVGLVKPDSEIYLLCLKNLNISPSRVLMIGDSLENDVIGAKKVGINSIWISNGDLKSGIPYATVKSLREVFETAEGYFKS